MPRLRTSLSRLSAALAAVLVCALSAGAATAVAETVAIEGDPLTVYVTDAGNLQSATVDIASFSFYPEGNQAGNAGFFIGFGDGVAAQNIAAGTFFGPPMPSFGPSGGNPFTLGSFGAVEEDGGVFTHVLTNTVDDPTDGSDVLEITQTTTYVAGDRNFTTRWEVRNVSGAPVSFRASAGADLFLEGSDAGHGYFSPGPPRFVGGVSVSPRRAFGFLEVTPWSAYQEDGYDAIWAVIEDPAGPGFADTIRPELLDNGIGVQWDNGGLASGATATYEVAWDAAPSTLTAAPETAEQPRGGQQTVTFTGAGESGPHEGVPLIYEIVGANPGEGQEPMVAGEAAVVWTGANAGFDWIEGYVDENGNGERDDDEPLASALITWTGPQDPGPGPEPGPDPEPEGPGPPVAGKTANLAPVKGTVEVKCPGDSGFEDLGAATQVPVGCLIDASKGTVLVTTSTGWGGQGANAAQTGATQSAQVWAGVFRLKQKAGKKPITDLVLAGSLKCGRKGGKKRKGGKAATTDVRADAARRRGRRLWGSGKGLFRSRGKGGSAAVRGTKWLTEDRCNGTTLFKVKNGVVKVRDFKAKKNVTLRKGQSYVTKGRKKGRR